MKILLELLLVRVSYKMADNGKSICVSAGYCEPKVEIQTTLSKNAFSDF